MWFRSETLPTGWGDFMIITSHNNEYQPVHIYERKTVDDLKASISNINRREQFVMLHQNAIQEGINDTIILETLPSDHFLMPPTFRADLTEQKLNKKITRYKCRAFLNAQKSRIVYTTSIIETAIFLFREIERAIQTTSSSISIQFDRPKCLSTGK